MHSNSPRFRLNLGGRWTIVTALIVAANIALFVFTYGNRPNTQEPSRLMKLLSLSYSGIASGHIWQIISASFIHSGMLQLFFTSIALYLMGSYTLRRLGFAWFMFTYLTCGFAGGLASSIISGSKAFEAAPAATFGIILLCVIYFPYMRFMKGINAKRLAPLLIATIILASLSFNGEDLAFLAQLTALPVAYVVFKIEPAVERMRNRRHIRKEIIEAFTEADREEHLDRLLKKVASEGIESLNRKERHFLETVSKEYRRKKVNNH